MDLHSGVFNMKYFSILQYQFYRVYIFVNMCQCYMRLFCVIVALIHVFNLRSAENDRSESATETGRTKINSINFTASEMSLRVIGSN